MTHDSSVETAKGEASKRRILEVFEREARIIGPKGVVMAELVRELGISVRRQTIWHQWGRFLRDGFLPLASPV